MLVRWCEPGSFPPEESSLVPEHPGVSHPRSPLPPQNYRQPVRCGCFWEELWGPKHLRPDSSEPPSPLIQHRELNLSAETQPIFGNRSLPEASLGPSCLLWGAWVKGSPRCPRRGSSPTRGAGRCIPQQACNHCPTCRNHTACTGRAGCRGSGARGGTDTANSSPANREDGW